VQAVINFRVLGTLELRTAGGRELHALLAQPKRVALLAYLCVARPPGFHRRDTLLGIFWPEADEAHARASLRKAIHVLRSAVGEDAILSRGDDEVGIDPARICCDAAYFEDALAAGHLEVGMELYRGELLEGLFLENVPAFERWVEEERARLRGEAGRLARMLAKRLEEARDYTGAVTMARRAVALAESDERMLRQLLELLDRLGDRAGALKTYDEFARRLAAEYETEPSVETRQLVARLRERSEPVTRRGSTHPATSPNDEPITPQAVAASLRALPARESTLPAVPGYRVERELGRGGMAVVYLAHDAKHDREVAIKVLRSDVAATLGAERFLDEIRTTARLSHPHIVPLLDSGSVDGVPYYVMPYVPGETLRQMLDRGGPLPVDDAVRLAGELASALSYAHGQGIVHLDVKPENILIESGQAVVADFGVSRAIATAMSSSPPAETSTQRTLILGSPAYMSPEQALGESRVDGRSDIYSLGCVVHHMLTGEPPFTGESASAILARKLAEDATPLRRLRSGLPVEVERVVGRAIRRAPADRFASTEDFASALTSAVNGDEHGHITPVKRHRARTGALLAGGVVVLALVAAAVNARRGSAGAEVRSIAILSIVATDSAQRPLADEIHARLIDDLAHVSALRVTGAESAARYRASTEPIETIARELDVDALVVARLTPLGGDSVSLDLSLHAGKAAPSPWAREFVTDVGHRERFRKQVARALLESLHVPLTEDERRWLERNRVTNPRAAELYKRGRRMADSFDPSRFENSIRAFEDAIRIDPDDPAPYVALAETYQTMVGARHVHNAPAEMLGLARRAIDRAIELDPDDAEAHTVKAGLLYMFDWNWADADREFRRAIALNPGSGKTHWQYGAYLRFNGWRDSAIAEHRRASRIDPLNPMFLGELSLAYAWANQGDSAVRSARIAVDLEPNLAPVRYARSHAFLSAGQFDSAIVEGKRAMELSPGFATRLAEVYVAAGRTAELEQLIASMPKPIDDWFWLILAARQGDRETALAYLDTLVQQHRPSFGVIRGDPAYASLASEPRFQAVLARMGLPPRPVTVPPGPSRH
jgi:serine/threonine-protein kinase